MRGALHINGIGTSELHFTFFCIKLRIVVMSAASLDRCIPISKRVSFPNPYILVSIDLLIFLLLCSCWIENTESIPWCLVIFHVISCTWMVLLIEHSLYICMNTFTISSLSKLQWWQHWRTLRRRLVSNFLRWDMKKGPSLCCIW